MISGSDCTKEDSNNNSNNNMWHDSLREDGGLKTRDWKTQHRTAGLEISGKGMHDK